MSENSGSFKKNFKKYDDNKTYEQYEEQSVEFDPSFLELADINDIRRVMDEINTLSYKLYYYGSLCDAQSRVVQQLEDEFERWKAEKYHAHKIDDKQYKTEKSKERFIYNQYMIEFQRFEQALSNEKYRLALLHRVVKSLEAFGYKLHDLKDYNLTIGRNS